MIYGTQYTDEELNYNGADGSSIQQTSRPPIPAVSLSVVAVRDSVRYHARTATEVLKILLPQP
jgi:hypothetical protein